MQDNVQVHASDALPPGKEPPVAIEWEVGWAPEPVWTRWRREKIRTRVAQTVA